ncbi:hypothetical protein BV22DRAFT_1028992 [Leucogyrophana mollusca]|uniref:Uncharacterized protein n=1 Tax=Leucogyrophana mollusca TaxID=85980 RepID=A0ACB8BWA5_9AGAM|nr:hypothetical protein BV22DRAFT_1028992 [Leucogyrophana mollusca]
MSYSSAPRLLWDSYVEYLWNYDPGSWVGRVASSFRIFAFILVLPVVILTLLDVTSYVIARTLGVVEDVKASTSDNPVMVAADTPSILVQDLSSPSYSEDVSSADEELLKGAQGHDTGSQLSDATADDLRPQAFFAGEEDVQLSGVGVFSPAASQPSSPVLSRLKLSGLDPGVEGVSGDIDGSQDEGIVLRKRTQGAQGSRSHQD